MQSNDSFSNEGSTNGQLILGDRGVEKENSGRARDVDSSVLSYGSSRNDVLVVPSLIQITAFPPGYRHPSSAIPLERPFFDRPEIPTDRVPLEAHLDRKSKCEKWLLENNVVDSSFIDAVQNVRITPEGYDMIKENAAGDYIPLLFAYSLSDEVHYNRLSPFRRFEREEGRGDRYNWIQKAWFYTDMVLFKNKNGRWPSSEEKYNMLENDTRRVFRPYFVLKEEALKEKVDFPGATELIQYVERELHYEKKKTS